MVASLASYSINGTVGQRTRVSIDTIWLANHSAFYDISSILYKPASTVQATHVYGSHGCLCTLFGGANYFIHLEASRLSHCICYETQVSIALYTQAWST